jgi:hypothetical protein
MSLAAGSAGSSAACVRLLVIFSAEAIGLGAASGNQKWGAQTSYSAWKWLTVSAVTELGAVTILARNMLDRRQDTVSQATLIIRSSAR